MLFPKKRKFRKAFKGRIHGVRHTGCHLVAGSYAIKAEEPERLTSRHIESARRVLARYIRRLGKIRIRVFPDLPVSSKPAETRMGRGKGAHDHWVCRVYPGRILFELEGVSESVARKACEVAMTKLPMRARFVSRSPLL